MGGEMGGAARRNPDPPEKKRKKDTTIFSFKWCCVAGLRINGAVWQALRKKPHLPTPPPNNFYLLIQS